MLLSNHLVTSRAVVLLLVSLVLSWGPSSHLVSQGKNPHTWLIYSTPQSQPALVSLATKANSNNKQSPCPGGCLGNIFLPWKFCQEQSKRGCSGPEQAQHEHRGGAIRYLLSPGVPDAIGAVLDGSFLSSLFNFSRGVMIQTTAFVHGRSTGKGQCRSVGRSC